MENQLLSIITFLPLVAAVILALFMRGDDAAARQGACTLVGLADSLAGAVGEALPHAFLGPEFGPTEIEAELRRARVRWTRAQNLDEQVAERLAAGQIVGRFDGRMEFGPRALGNRSILAAATDFPGFGKGPADPSIDTKKLCVATLDRAAGK